MWESSQKQMVRLYPRVSIPLIPSPPHHPQGQTVHTGSAGFGGPTPITLLTWCLEATGRVLGIEGVLWGLR